MKRNYDLFTTSSPSQLQIQRCDETAPDGYTDDHAAIDFVRDLEQCDPTATEMAIRLIGKRPVTMADVLHMYEIHVQTTVGDFRQTTYFAETLDQQAGFVRRYNELVEGRHSSIAKAGNKVEVLVGGLLHLKRVNDPLVGTYYTSRHR